MSLYDELKRRNVIRVAAGYVVAEVYAFRNEKDAAFEWLEKLLQKPPSPIFGKYALIESTANPLLHNLHDDPRWEQFRMKVGVPTELVESLEFSIDIPH